MNQDIEVNPSNLPDKSSGFWSIERAVAFVFAPILTAASGYVSILIATKFPGHPEIPSESIYAFASATSLTVGGLLYKWLDGRSKHTITKINAAAHEASVVLANGGLSVDDQQGLLKIAEEDIQRIAETASQKAVASINQAAGQITSPVSPMPEPIVESGNDPAPPTPVSVEAPGPETPAPVVSASPVTPL